MNKKRDTSRHHKKPADATDPTRPAGPEGQDKDLAPDQPAEPHAPSQAPPPDAAPQQPGAEELARHVEQLQRDKEQLVQQLQRTAADYHNAVKRADAQQAEAVRLAQGDLLKKLLPVLDHFDNALACQPTGPEARAVYEGMRIVRDELLQVLTQCGVQTIEPQPGQPFDPHCHEAMLQQPAQGVQPNHVSALLQVGYRFGQRTLRPAKVAVAPESPAGTDQPAAQDAPCPAPPDQDRTGPDNGNTDQPTGDQPDRPS